MESGVSPIPSSFVRIHPSADAERPEETVLGSTRLAIANWQGREESISAPKEQPPRKLSGKRTGRSIRISEELRDSRHPRTPKEQVPGHRMALARISQVPKRRGRTKASCLGASANDAWEPEQ